MYVLYSATLIILYQPLLICTVHLPSEVTVCYSVLGLLHNVFKIAGITHLLFAGQWLGCALTSDSSILDGLIVGILLMLFPVYNTKNRLKIDEYKPYWLKNIFVINNWTLTETELCDSFHALVN